LRRQLRNTRTQTHTSRKAPTYAGGSTGGRGEKPGRPGLTAAHLTRTSWRRCCRCSACPATM